MSAALRAGGTGLAGHAHRRAGDAVHRTGSTVGGADRLRRAFATGELLRPTDDVPNLVDLGRAVASASGAPVALRTRGAELLRDLIGEPSHLVLLLVDGLGLGLLERRSPTSTLRRLLATELRSVFPSSTASALTSLATGEWPARHAVVGWWTHMPTIDAAAVLLHYQRRSDRRPLDELGITPAQAFPTAPLIAQADRDTLSLLPREFVDSPYSRYASGGGPRRGYLTLRDAVDAVIERTRSAREPTFSYVYTPRIDSIAHEAGTGHPELDSAVAELEEVVEHLAVGLGAGSRLLVTADHGHLDAPVGRRHPLRPGSILDALQRVPPSGDPRAVYFHLRPDGAAKFHENFEGRFGNEFALLSVEELEEMELLGPGPLGDEARRRVGDAVAISLGASILGMPGVTGGRAWLAFSSHHSGLTPAEMRVPLLIA